MSDSKAPKFEVAPKERIRFTVQVSDFILEILRHPEPLITDESKLSDFCMFDSDTAKGPGSKPGYYLFKARWRKPGTDF